MSSSAVEIALARAMDELSALLPFITAFGLVLIARALDMGVLLRADIYGIAADDARLPAHPGGRGRAGAEAICAMVLFPIQLSKNKRPGGGPGQNTNASC